MFRNPEYVAWANEKTVHFLSYSLDPNAAKPEPVLDVVRDGEKTQVLEAYPTFTPIEAEVTLREANDHVKFPTHTPWAGVVEPRAGVVLAEKGKADAKGYRDLYDGAAKTLEGPVVPLAEWRKARALVAKSADLQLDEKWAEAVTAALEARAAVPKPTSALADRVKTRLDALDEAGTSRLDAAKAENDAKKRAALLAAVAKNFAGLPSGEAAASALARK